MCMCGFTLQCWPHVWCGLPHICRAQLQAAVDKFCSELLPGDHIIFFFAGHGEIQHSTHKHHLVCKEDEADQGFTVKTEDTDDRDSQQTTAATGSSLSKVGLATQDILMKIGAAVGRTGAVVALLDTCRAVTHRCSTSSSGRNTVADTAASESVVLAMLTKEDLDIHILLIELLTQQKELQQLLQTGSSTAASKLLAGKYTPKLLCHACGHGQVAYEGAGLDNGWYTHCLLKVSLTFAVQGLSACQQSDSVILDTHQLSIIVPPLSP